MTQPELAEHFTRFLGEGQHAAQLDRGVELWRYERPEFVTFVTRGLSDLDIAALTPQELVCSVLPGQDGAAAQLVTVVFEQLLATDRGPAIPQLIPNATPILDRTQIHGLLATGHPYLDDAFDAIVNNGTVVLRLVTLIPLTGTEVRQAQTSGLDSLTDTLEATDPALLDVRRTG